MSEVYRSSCWTVCQRVCSTCKVHMSLQWARPASAASAPIRTRPRTLAGECAPCCRIRTKILFQCVPVLSASPQLTYFFAFFLFLPAWLQARAWGEVCWCLLEGGRTRKKNSMMNRRLFWFLCRWSQLLHDADWPAPAILKVDFKKKSFKLGFSGVLSFVCP